MCNDECPSTSCHLPFYHEDSNLYLERALVKEDIHIETSSSPHLPVCPTIRNTSTCIGDTPRSSVSLSDELSPRVTQSSEVVHDEFENSPITEHTSHSLSSLCMHEDDTSNQLVEAGNSIKTCDRDGFHPESSFEIKNSSHPQAMHDMVHASK